MCNPVSTLHPELLIAKGTHLGYEWEITSNRMGYRCGYVRVPPGHPWYGLHYDAVEPYPEVHGGLTFSETDYNCGKGGADDAWWLGFDCAHCGDAPDPALPGYLERMEVPGCVVRTTGYVQAECEGLAAQAAARVATAMPGLPLQFRAR